VCADAVTLDAEGAGSASPVPDLVQALPQIAALRNIPGDALERGLGFERRQFFRQGAIAFTGAQLVDRSVKIARRRIESDGEQQQTGKSTQAHGFSLRIESIRM